MHLDLGGIGAADEAIPLGEHLEPSGTVLVVEELRPLRGQAELGTDHAHGCDEEHEPEESDGQFESLHQRGPPLPEEPLGGPKLLALALASRIPGALPTSPADQRARARPALEVSLEDHHGRGKERDDQEEVEGDHEGAKDAERRDGWYRRYACSQHAEEGCGRCDSHRATSTAKSIRELPLWCAVTPVLEVCVSLLVRVPQNEDVVSPDPKNQEEDTQGKKCQELALHDAPHEYGQGDGQDDLGHTHGG
mmetsp:Transcript_40415/g.107038  ORF Transcript_40415/g.107038 Transcript_40415/m.107038 type:complete len:250 (-) Transcript_40415:656-1405(-)